MAYAPGVGTGYVSVGDYLDANRDTLAREQGQISQGVGQQIDAAQSASDAAIAADRANYTPDFTTLPQYGQAKGLITGAQDQATALGSHGGVSDYFQKHFGDSSAQGGFDANLLGYNAGPLQARANSLTGYLDSGLAGVAPPAAPAAEPRDREPKPPGEFPGRPGSPADYPTTPNPNPDPRERGKR